MRAAARVRVRYGQAHMNDAWAHATRTFRSAGSAFAELVGRIPERRWDAPGLGEWSVRDLVGHTGRALVTVTTYLAAPADRVELDDGVAYFQAALAGDPAAIARRGREAGAALGPDPAAAVRQQLAAALTAVAAASPDTVAGTPFGGIRALEYLPTRTFELTVHSLDLCAACQLPMEVPEEPLEASLELAARLALRSGKAARLLLLATGRPLAGRETFTVL
jgi:uncharacterized protein (TIGR03083 family)